MILKFKEFEGVGFKRSTEKEEEYNTIYSKQKRYKPIGFKKHASILIGDGELEQELYDEIEYYVRSSNYVAPGFKYTSKEENAKDKVYSNLLRTFKLRKEQIEDMDTENPEYQILKNEIDVVERKLKIFKRKYKY